MFVFPFLWFSFVSFSSFGMARIVFNQADNDCQERSERSNIKNFMYSNKNFYMVLDDQNLFDRFISHINEKLNNILCNLNKISDWIQLVKLVKCNKELQSYENVIDK